MLLHTFLYKAISSKVPYICISLIFAHRRLNLILRVRIWYTIILFLRVAKILVPKLCHYKVSFCTLVQIQNPLDLIRANILFLILKKVVYQGDPVYPYIFIDMIYFSIRPRKLEGIIKITFTLEWMNILTKYFIFLY